jgi:hypothetical protein
MPFWLQVLSGMKPPEQALGRVSEQECLPSGLLEQQAPYSSGTTSQQTLITKSALVRVCQHGEAKPDRDGCEIVLIE